MDILNYKEMALLAVLALFVFFSVAIEYVPEDATINSIFYVLAFYYGLLGIALALFWDLIFCGFPAKKHKSEEG